MRSLFVRDEREAAVEQGGDRLAYIVVSYGLLLIVAYRSFVERQASWDLLALVVGWRDRERGIPNVEARPEPQCARAGGHHDRHRGHCRGSRRAGRSHLVSRVISSLT